MKISKLINLRKGLQLLSEEGWIIESERNKILIWHPNKEILESKSKVLNHLNWKTDGEKSDKIIVYYL